MTRKDLPSPELLRKLLRYQPETGKLFWLPRPIEMFATVRAGKIWNGRFADTEALNCLNYRGYMGGKIFGHNFRTHRVAWAIHYGKWPVGDIDHINGDTMDNRIKNLRDVSRQVNLRNASLSRNNTSGVNGVSWSKEKSKWQSRIRIGDTYRSLGYFEDIEDAAHARKMANIKYGFTSRHGL